MLNAIRTKSASWIVKGLFVILIGAFGAWGIGDIFRSGTGSQTPIIKIGSRFSYSQSEFQRDLRQSLERINRGGKSQITPEQFAALGGVEQLIQRALNNGLLRTYSTGLNLTIPANQAVAAIQQQKVFQNDLGKFDRAIFEQLLSSVGVSEAAYVETVRNDLRDQMLFDAFFAPVSSPKILIDASYQFGFDQRSALLLEIPADSMRVEGNPSDSELQTYFDKNKGQYKKPESKAINLVLLRPEDFIKDAPVSEDEIHQEYDARKTEFVKPEKREIEQILLPDEERAQKLDREIKAGMNFADAIAKELKAKPIQLGNVLKSELPKDIADAAFALKQGEVSGPVKSPLGYHLLHILAVSPEQVEPLESVKEQLRQSVALTKAGDVLADIVNKMEDDLAGGASLSDVAAKMNTKIANYSVLTAEGKTADGSDSGLSREILSLIWSENGVNQIHQLSDGSYAIFDILSTKPAEDQKLSDVRDAVIAAFNKEEQHKKALEKARELAAGIKAQGDLETSAKILGLTPTKVENITRTSGAAEKGIDALTAEQIFKASVHQALAVETTKGGLVAFVIDAMNAKLSGPEYTNFTAQMDQSLRNDLAASFSHALEQQLPVTIHRDIADRLIQ